MKQKQEYMHYANAWDARAATYLQQMKETQNKLDTANLNIQDWHLRNVLQRAKAALGVSYLTGASRKRRRRIELGMGEISRWRWCWMPRPNMRETFWMLL